MRSEFHQELREHFAYRPYLDLGVSVDAATVFKEFLQIQECLVQRQRTIQGAQANGWQACALRSYDGISSTVETEEYYGMERILSGEFQMSDLASRCKKTIEYISIIADIAKCRRIRFMTLEPGAQIPLHTDAKTPLSTIIYCGIRYPSQCSYMIASEANTWQKVPIVDGSVFMIDISRPHTVINHSDQTRVSLLIEGQPQMSIGQIIDRARIQNQLEYAQLVPINLQAVLSTKNNAGL